MKTKPPKKTFTHAVDERTELQREIVNLLNLHRDLKKETRADLKALSKSKQLIEAKLANFESDSGHSNHPWIVTTVKSLAASAFGEQALAISLSKEALELANTDTERGKNANNLCQFYRDDDPVEAVRWGYYAILWTDGRNEGVVLTYAQALHAANRYKEAEHWISEVSKEAALSHKGDILTAHLKFEDYFRDNMLNLKIIRELYRDLQRKTRKDLK